MSLEYYENLLSEKIRDYLKNDLQYLRENKDKFNLIYGSFLYGNLGVQIRNYVRNLIPEIDTFFKGEYDDWYQKFEDVVYKVTKNIVFEDKCIV